MSMDSTSTWSDMDEYLDHLGLQRKSITNDESCLFRAVADQVLLSQEQHLLVRRECVCYLQKKRAKFQHFVEGPFDEYLKQLSNPEVRPGQLELVALSEMHKHDFVIFMDVHRPPMSVTQNSFKNQIVLCLSNSNHYDIVYPKSFMRNSHFCRTLLYDLLHQRVFTMNRDRMGAERDPCSTPERTNAECEIHRKSPSDMSVTESEKLMANSAKDNMAHPEEVDSAEGPQSETGKEDGCNQMGLCAGDKCQVILGDQKFYQAHIQEVSEDKQSAWVLVEELGIKSSVPFSSLHPLNKPTQDVDPSKRRQRKRREMPLVIPFGRGSVLPTRLHSRTPGRAAGRATPPRLAAQETPTPGSQVEDEEEERKFIQDSVALIELQERDPTAFPALPNRQDSGKGPKSFWGDEVSFADVITSNQKHPFFDNDEEAPTQLSVSPPPSPRKSSPAASSSPHIRTRPLVGPRLTRTAGPSIPVLSAMPVMPPMTIKDSPLFMSSSTAGSSAKVTNHNTVKSSQSRNMNIAKTMPKPKYAPLPIVPCDVVDQTTVKQVPAPVKVVTNSVVSSGSLGSSLDETSSDTSIDSQASGNTVTKQQSGESSKCDSDKTMPKATLANPSEGTTVSEAQESSKCSEVRVNGSEEAAKSTRVENAMPFTMNEGICPSSPSESSCQNDHSQSTEGTSCSTADHLPPQETPTPCQGPSHLPVVPHLVSNSAPNAPSVPQPVQPMNTVLNHPANTLRPPLMHPLAFPQPPPLPPRMPFSVPSYPWLAVTSPHLSNMAGPINFNVMPSSDPSGSDLPHTDVNTLRFFFNLGYEYYRASMIQLSAQFPILPRPSEDGSRGPESSQSKNQSKEEKPEETNKKSEGVVVYVENDEESSSSSTEEDKENHNTSYEELTSPCHGDSGCVSDVSSNENEHRNNADDHHSDSSSQHSNGSMTLSAEFINFCRTFCSPASSHSQNGNNSRRSPMVPGKLTKPLKDIPPRFQKMLSQNAVGKEQQFEGPPLLRQVAMSSHKNSSKNSSASTLNSSNPVEDTSSQSPGHAFNPNAQSFTPSSTFECSSNQSYSPVVYSQSDNGAPFPASEEYPPPYSYYMNGTCYYPPSAMGHAPVPVPAPAPAPAPGGTQYMQCQYYMPYPQPYQGAPTTVVYSNAPQQPPPPPPPTASYNHYPAPQPPAPATHYTYTT